MSLRRQIWVVLLSYLTRTGFRWAIVSGLSGFSLMLIGAGCRWLLGFPHGEGNPFGFLIGIGVMTIMASLVAALVLFFLHARQQLMGPTARFMPNTRRPNLIVAAGLFFAIVLAISWTIHELDWFPGIILTVLFFMALIACAVCNPWLIPFPVIALLLLSYNVETQIAVNEITQKWNLAMFPNATPREMTQLILYEHYIWALRAILLLLDILALVFLERISRPRRSGFSLLQNVRTILIFFPRGSRASIATRHAFLQTPLARIVHRRFAIHDWRAAVFLAGVVAALTAMLSHIAGEMTDPLISIVAMLAVLPGALAAIGWRDRWGSYEFETLYPAKHQEFVSEMIIALLLDMIEYWIASLAAVLLTILALRPEILHESQLWVAIAGSVMMQVLWAGGIALAGQRRQTVPYVAGLAIAVLAMLLTFDNLHRADSHVYPMHFIAIATVEMLAGFLFLAIATLVCRRRAAA